MRIWVVTLALTSSLLATPRGVVAGELLVGFASDLPIAIGDSATLVTSEGPTLGPITAMCSSPDGVFVATSGSIRRLDPNDGSVLASFVPPHAVTSMAWGNQGLLLAGPPGKVSRIDPSTGALLLSSTTIGEPSAIAASGGLVYVAVGDHQLWSALESNLQWTMEIDDVGAPVSSLAVRGSLLLVGTSGHVFILERVTNALVYGYNIPNDAITLDLDGNQVVVGGSDGSLARVDVSTAAVEGTSTFVADGQPQPISAAAIHAAAPFASLKLDVGGVSLTQPAPAHFRLEVSDAIGDLSYLILGSASGTVPGMNLAGTNVPLNQDAYTLATLAGTPLLLGAVGTFSTQNALQLPLADASFSLPTGLPPSLAGLTLTHAFLAFDPATATLVAVSNPIDLFIAP